MTPEQIVEASKPYHDALLMWRGSPEEAFANPLQAARDAAAAALYRAKVAETQLAIAA